MEVCCLDEAQIWRENISVCQWEQMQQAGDKKKKALIHPRRRTNMTDKPTKLYLTLCSVKIGKINLQGSCIPYLVAD